MTPVTLARCEGCSAAEAERDDANDALAQMAEILATATPEPNIIGSDVLKVGETVPTIKATTTIRDRGQVTLPPKIRRAIGVETGDSIEFTLNDDGTVTLRMMRLVPLDAPR